MDEMQRRELAVKRVKDKRDFHSHVASYLVVNALLVVIWTLTGAGYFWPVWPMAGWGVGLIFHAWSVYFAKPISEEEVRREMERIS